MLIGVSLKKLHVSENVKWNLLLSICTVSSVHKSEDNERLEFTYKVHKLHKQQLAVKKRIIMNSYDCDHARRLGRLREQATAERT